MKPLPKAVIDRFVQDAAPSVVPRPETDTGASTPALDHERLLHLLDAYRSTCLLLAALATGLVDALRDTPKDAARLARETGAHPLSLARLLRGLERIGLVEQRGDAFRLTSMGVRLADPMGDERARATLVAEEHLGAWQHLSHAVLTGETAFERAFGMSAWEHRARRPELSAAFDRAMAGDLTRAAHAVASAYDFARSRAIVDVGGGRGALLAELLAQYPLARGIVFDQPHVVDDASSVLQAAGVEQRASIVGGSFFDAVPAGGDTYVLHYVLHDWSDERCAVILRNCHAAMAPGARLLIVENLIPEHGSASDRVVMLDLHMMAMLGGRERTADEFRTLLRAAGFDLLEILPAGGTAHVVVAGATAAASRRPA